MAEAFDREKALAEMEALVADIQAARAAEVATWDLPKVAAEMASLLDDARQYIGGGLSIIDDIDEVLERYTEVTAG